jgi:hypothetical protein
MPPISAGGVDMTSTFLAWWTLMMLAYPETQARAQAELDEVAGRSRLPTFADYLHLHYIRAMVKEISRSGALLICLGWHTDPLRTIGTKECSSLKARSASPTFGN